MTTPRGLTQPYTSFIGSACQGIHHAPLITNTQTTTHKSAGGHTSELDKINTKKKSHKHTQHTTQKRSPLHVFNARVHYTVLTQHPNHKPAHTNHAHQQNGQAPQKGDNAPDTQQCTNVQSTLIFVYMDTFTHVTKHHSNTRYCRLRCVSYPEFPNIGGSRTLAHSTTNPHNTKVTQSVCSGNK